MAPPFAELASPGPFRIYVRDAADTDYPLQLS